MSCLEPIATFPTQMEAELARSRLESAGIVAHVFADNEGGQLPGVSLSGGGFRVMIDSAQKDDAEKILADEP